jgi:hypothetical protein
MRFTLLFIAYSISLSLYSQYEISRTFLRDDFGGWHSIVEISEIIHLSKLNKTKKLEIQINETTKKSKSVVSYPPGFKEKTRFLYEFTSDTTISVLKEYEGKGRCYKSGYNFLIINNVFTLNSVFIPEEDSLCFKCNYEDLHKDFLQYPFDSIHYKTIGDTTVLTVKQLHSKNPTDKNKVYDYSSIEQFYFLNDTVIKIVRPFSLSINYSCSGDTLITKYISENQIDIEKKVVRIEQKNNHKYLKHISVFSYGAYFSSSKSEYIWSKLIKKDKTLVYKLNKEMLPINIKVKKDWLLKGSEIIVKYYK